LPALLRFSFFRQEKDGNLYKKKKKKEKVAIMEFVAQRLPLQCRVSTERAKPRNAVTTQQ
jgi:hypothetical protein